MNENKDLQVIYNYLTNEVPNDEIKELVIYLREYVLNGSWVEYETTPEDVKHFADVMQLFNQ